MKEIWPGYETVRLIGKGTYGAVYEIKKTDAGGEYFSAVKKISIPASEEEYTAMLDGGYEEEEIRSYFESRLSTIIEEFRIMERFKGNSNIVSYEDHMVIEHKNSIGWDILIRMELLQNLPSMIREKGALTPAQVIRLGKDICDALILIHSEKIVHRDIKPQNIFVNRFGAFKLGDFGIAKTLSSASKATMAGTPDYIAPEVYHEHAYGVQADQYSLGLVLYWALNGRKLPFYPVRQKLSAQLIEEAMAKRMSGEMIPAPLHGSEALAKVILKACAFDPKDRYADIRAFQEALIQCEKSENNNGDISVSEDDNAEEEEDFESGKTIGHFPEIKPAVKTTVSSESGGDVQNGSAIDDDPLIEILEKHLPSLALSTSNYQLEYALKPSPKDRIVKTAEKITEIPDTHVILGILSAYDKRHSLKHTFVFTDRSVYISSDPKAYQIMKIKSVPYAQIESVTFYGSAHKRLRIRRHNIEKPVILYLNESASSMDTDMTVCDPAALKKMLELLISAVQRKPAVNQNENKKPDKQTGKKDETIDVIPFDAFNEVIKLCEDAIDAERKLRYNDADRFNGRARTYAEPWQMYAIGCAYGLGAVLNVKNGNTKSIPSFSADYRTVYLQAAGAKAKKITFPKNVKRAIEWLEAAGKFIRDARAYLICALLCEFEEPVRDFRKARQFVNKAAKADSQYTAHRYFYQNMISRLEQKASGSGIEIARLLAGYRSCMQLFSAERSLDVTSLTDSDFHARDIYIGSFLNEGLNKAMTLRRKNQGKLIAEQIEDRLKNEKVLCVYHTSKNTISWIFTDRTLYLYPFMWQRKSRNPSKNNVIERWGNEVACLWIDLGVIDQVKRDRKTMMITFNVDQNEFKNFSYFRSAFSDPAKVCDMMNQIIGICMAAPVTQDTLQSALNQMSTYGII